MQDLALMAWLFTPLFVGLAVNGLCMKYDILRGLARPVDGGRTWRGAPLFGASKTWRGIAAVCGGTALAYAIRAPLWRPPLAAASLSQWPSACVFGAALGGAAMLAELPNSFVKRRLRVAPGKTAARASSGFRCTRSTRSISSSGAGSSSR
jgi:CDP-2,3-bis-(O-geranylgeranyl)-sn-glycerol synthase